MAKPPKIVIIGAGSAIFGLGALVRLLRSERLRGAELALVDTREDGLLLMTALAEKLNKQWNTGKIITHSTDRTELLPGADIVIVSIQVGQRETVWEMDWQIPLRHGVRQPYAENGGPGAFSHTARNLPVMLGIARDMERLCPNAWYLNVTNPLIRLTHAVNKYTNIKILGLCHQLLWGYAMAAPWILGFVIFVLGPSIASLYYSFTDYRLGRSLAWVGLDNYRDLIGAVGAHGRRFAQAMYNSFYYAVVGVPLQIVTALAMAMLVAAPLLLTALAVGLAIGVACQFVLVPLVTLPVFLLSDVETEDLEAPARELTDKATGPGVLVLVLVVVVMAPLAERRAAAAQAEAEAARQAQDQARRDEERRQAEEEARQEEERQAEEDIHQASVPSYLTYPVNAPISSEFGNRLHPVLGIWLLHAGMDFAASCGTSVVSAADGVVFSTGYNDRSGHYVIIDHGVHRGVNLTTTYMHFQTAPVVASGQGVGQGQVVGQVGTTGSSTGCHLHFETRENGAPVNPRGWL